MSIIKLDAIDSTNDFLKELARNQSLENFTAVVALAQHRGRGQMGTQWVSEPDKNLIMSVLLKDIPLKIDDVFVLNALVSVAVIEAIRSLEIPNLSVKWPNDIMSESKKIGGILVENSLKTDTTITSIIGLGLNVNQLEFHQLPNASSLRIQSGKEFEIDDVMLRVLDQIKILYPLIVEGKYDDLWERYHNHLFRKDIPTVFEDVSKKRFMGIIECVNPQGKLEVRLENDAIASYFLKEIQMIY
jgi:BirA family transcriptional regulator, biotin operon repressor / biotin---[acetyl-CoA-carboxylase] ligase